MAHTKSVLKHLEAQRGDIIGEILKYLRIKSKSTQNEIAKRIGIAQQTYAGYETGKHQPSIEVLIILADLYGIPMDLITGRDINGNIEDEIERMLALTEEYYKMQRANTKSYIDMAKNKV